MRTWINKINLDKLIEEQLNIGYKIAPKLVNDIKQNITRHIKAEKIKTEEDLVNYLRQLRKQSIKICQEKYNYYIN